MRENYCISPNYDLGVYYQLPFIDRYMTGVEWKFFTVLFNQIMIATKHDKIKVKPIEITHEWIAEKLGLDKEKDTERTSQRNVKRLEKLGDLKVYRTKREGNPNKYELNWDVINTLAQCQVEGKDKNVALSEVKNVLYIEDIFVSPTEDKNVSQIINNNKTKNKNNNKGNTKPAGSNPKSVSVSAMELDGIVDMVLSSDEGSLSDVRRNNPSRALKTSVAHSSMSTEQQPQSNSKVVSETTAEHSHSPIVGDKVIASANTNLQSSVALAPSHPPIAPTPLSPSEELVIKYCDKYYNHGSEFPYAHLDGVCKYLNRFIEDEGNSYTETTLAKVESTYAYLRNGMDRGYFF